MSASTKEVTQFFKDLIVSSGVYDVDAEGYVVTKEGNNRVTIEQDSKNFEIILFQENIKASNAWILNPLAEGLTDNPSSRWLNSMLSASLLSRIFVIFNKVIEAAISEKKAKEEAVSHINMEVLNHASKIIDIVDARVLKDLQVITNSDPKVAGPGEFLVIWYQKKQLRSVLRSALFETQPDPNNKEDVSNYIPTWKSKFPNITVKAWNCFEKIMLSILNLTDKDDISKFSRKAPVLSCVKFSSFFSVLIAVYQEINSILDVIDPSLPVDLTKFVSHLNRLDDYTENAKFMRQSVPAATGTPAQQVQTAIPSVPHQVAYAPQPEVRLIPTVPNPDGTPAAPIQVVQQPMPQYQAPVMYPSQMMQQRSPIPAMPMPGTLPSPQPMYQVQQPVPMMPPMGMGYPQNNYGMQNNVPFDGPYVQAPLYGNQPNMYGQQQLQYPNGPMINPYG